MSTGHQSPSPPPQQPQPSITYISLKLQFHDIGGGVDSSIDELCNVADSIVIDLCEDGLQSNHWLHALTISGRSGYIPKIGNYGKYTALTALGTYLILNPKKAQAASPEAPGDGF